MNVPGKLSVRPSRANITRNTQWFGTMDPFVQLEFQNQQQSSEVSKAGGKNPTWNNTLYFNRLGSNLLSITLYDHESFKAHDLIGSVEIDISDIFIKTQPTTRWVELFFQGKVSAAVQLQFMFRGIDMNQSVSKGSGGGSLMMSKKSKLGAKQNIYQQPQYYNKPNNQFNSQNQMFPVPQPYNNHPPSVSYNNQNGNNNPQSYTNYSNQYNIPNNQYQNYQNYNNNNNNNNNNNYGMKQYYDNPQPSSPYLATKVSNNNQKQIGGNPYEIKPSIKDNQSNNKSIKQSEKKMEKKFTAEQMDNLLDD